MIYFCVFQYIAEQRSSWQWMGRIALIGWSLGCGAIHEYSAVYCQVYYNEVQYACNTLYCAIYYNAVELMGVIAVHNSVGRLDVSYTFSALQ